MELRKGIHKKDIQIRDPFVFPSEMEGVYYLFGTTDKDPWNKKGVGFDAYISNDLESFEGPFPVFRPSDEFWGSHDFWAPEVHYYQNRYYLFATFTSDSCRRGTQILASDRILGPYHPLVNQAVTPGKWECLDGTFYIDSDGAPWMIFCHEWVQAHDGAIYAMPLKQDLSGAAGEPILLFRASAAAWTRTLERRDASGLKDARVTDGPYLHLQQDGQLVMLWSSLGELGYVMGCALSANGSLLGPWTQNAQPLVEGDGGHGMVFKNLDGSVNITYHSPNQTPLERFVHQKVIESPRGLIPAEKTDKR